MEHHYKSTGEDNTISLTLAETLCANWRAAYSAAFPSVPPLEVFRGFRIPILDITQLAAQSEAVAVRAYMGMANPTDSSTVTLLLVPVVLDEAGNEVDKIINTVPGGQPQYFIYDFTQPCPSVCDVTSPLYGTQQHRKP